jgi:dihydropteroate synthase
MGIVNVTPDSFSDGGMFLDPDAAFAHALQLVADGADILDIGGESTRPYSEPLPERDELARVLPVIDRLAADTIPVPISIDTRKAAVAQAAIERGAQIVNDISGLEGDPAMIGVVAASGVGVCAMHIQGRPLTMQDNPTYDDVVVEVGEYLRSRRDALVRAGLDVERICLDPGLGFGKTVEHNVTLLQNCWQFHELGCPILAGPSRKGFLGALVGDSNADRTAATIGAVIGLAAQGVQVLRVHDVRHVREALAVYEASGFLNAHNSP